MKKECSDNSEHTQTINVTFGHDKMAYENIENGKTETSLPSKGSTLPQIKPEILEKRLYQMPSCFLNVISKQKAI